MGSGRSARVLPNERWSSDGVVYALISSKTADEILADPRFADASQAHVNAMIEVFAGNRFLIRLMKDAACLKTAALLVGFHAMYDQKDRTTWATPGRIRGLVAREGLASVRRMDDLIARLLHTRYVTSISNESDRRTRILRPTELLLSLDRVYLAALHRPLHLLYPERGHRRIVAQDIWLHLAIRRMELFALPTAKPYISRHQGITFFLTRDAGYLAFLLVAQAAQQLNGAGLSYTEIAQRLGVSRTHIRNLFVDAEAGGYIDLSENRGRVSKIRPRLWDAFHIFLAETQARRDAIAQMAFAERRLSN
jgi:hypothetical protein